MLRLHYHPFSTFSRRVRVALIEKDIPHELVEVDLAKRENRGEAFLAMNPQGKVPVLQEGDFFLPESAAILWYLESIHPEPPLVPADPRARARVDLWVRLCDAGLAGHSLAVVFPKRFLPRERWDTAAMAAASREIQAHLERVETQLGRSPGPWLLGEEFTLADVAYLPFLHFLHLLDVEAGPNVLAWAARLAARPSAHATVPAA